MTNTETLPDSALETVARYFGLLSEPMRLKILRSICQEEKCVADIVAETDSTQPNISRHLAIMYRSRVISRRREGSQTFYAVADSISIDLCRTVCAAMMAAKEFDTIPAKSSNEIESTLELK